MTQLTRLLSSFAGIWAFAAGAGIAYASDEVQGANETLSRAQTQYYETLRSGKDTAGPAAAREAIVAPAARNLGRVLQKRQDAVVKDSLQLDRTGNFPQDVSEDDSAEESDKVSAREAISPSEQAVIDAILGGDEAAEKSAAEKPAAGAPAAVRPVRRGGARPSVSTPAPAPREENELKVAPKAGDGVNVIEF